MQTKKLSLWFQVVVFLLGMAPLFAQTTLRGAMFPDRAPAQLLVDLRNHGANLARVEILNLEFVRPPAPHEVVDYMRRYDEWINAEIQHFQQVTLPTAERIGLRLCLDLHVTPGGRNPANARDTMFDALWARYQYLVTVTRIAAALGNHPAVWAFDIANEPGGRRGEWRRLAAEAALAIRTVAPRLRLVIESPYGSINQLVEMEPLPLDRCVYSFHFYHPVYFTAQGLDNFPDRQSFPGRYRNVWNPYNYMWWNAATITEMTERAAQWADQHGVRIFVGEFSSRADRPGSEPYMRGCINAFERHGFQWTYHAFREADVWNHENGAAWGVIRNAFARN